MLRIALEDLPERDFARFQLTGPGQVDGFADQQQRAVRLFTQGLVKGLKRGLDLAAAIEPVRAIGLPSTFWQHHLNFSPLPQRHSA